MSTCDDRERRTAVHLLRGGIAPPEVARTLGRSLAWVYKWHKRFFAAGRWKDVQARARAPHVHPNRLTEATKQAIRRVRRELEEEAEQPDHLAYRGARAIRTRLKRQGWAQLPSLSSIERVVAAAGMIRPHRTAESVSYPQLHPTQPHEVVPMDIVPRFLPGEGGCVSCFNALDMVSRYPVGYQADSKHAQQAITFLLTLWQEMGIPDYLQMDNESCFSGGTAHPRTFSKVVRLCLWVGTQVVFTPFYHPQSNALVERFHQDYLVVWDKQNLSSVAEVRQHSAVFFQLYRQSEHIEALAGQCPQEVHFTQPIRQLPRNLVPPKRLPLTAGQVHFMRLVDAQQQVTILNERWTVAGASPGHGVWATLELRLSGATLRIYDAAPDAPTRICLAEHDFPLQEQVQPLDQACQPTALPVEAAMAG